MKYEKVADIKSSWSDRIPFVLLFGIATSVELFQEKLSRDTIRHLDGAAFDVQQVDVEDVFKAFQSEQPALWVGPGLSRLILQRQKDYIQSQSTFMNSLKVRTAVLYFVSMLKRLLVRLHDSLLCQSTEHLSRHKFITRFYSNRAL